MRKHDACIRSDFDLFTLLPTACIFQASRSEQRKRREKEAVYHIRPLPRHSAYFHHCLDLSRSSLLGFSFLQKISIESTSLHFAFLHLQKSKLNPSLSFASSSSFRFLSRDSRLDYEYAYARIEYCIWSSYKMYVH